MAKEIVTKLRSQFETKIEMDRQAQTSLLKNKNENATFVYSISIFLYIAAEKNRNLCTLP